MYIVSYLDYAEYGEFITVRCSPFDLAELRRRGKYSI